MLLVALATLLLASVRATTPDNVSSRLSINIPRSLYKEEGYDHREALFGTPPYGGSIAQNVYYADSELCDSEVDTTKGYPKRDNDEPWQSPYILMVDRGGCTFVQKVRNAQRAGAAGVIIADNTCLCSDTACVVKAEDGVCETSEPIMADDGSGGDISIPSFLMFKVDADKVKKELVDNGQPVRIEMAWSLPNPDDRVEYDLWTVPSDAVSKNFLLNFKPVAKALDEKAYFTPHMYIYDGVRSGCQGRDGNNCYTLCTNEGRYCATDPDNDLDKGISGADVVKESLRRLCIWKHYGEKDGIGLAWWDYLAKFFDRCNSEAYFANEDCAKDCYKYAGIDKARIDQCMRDSGGLEGDVANSFLDSEIDAQSERGVVVLPTAFVNTAAIRGQLTSNSVFHAICAGYAEGTTPDICKKCSSCTDSVECVETGFCKATGTGGAEKKVSLSFFMGSMLLLLAFGGFSFYVHNQRVKAQMRDQVRGILAEYVPLGGDDEDEPGMNFAKRDFANPIS